MTSGTYLKMRTFYLLFNSNVRNPIDVADSIGYLCRGAMESRKIRSKNFYGNLGLCSRKHGVNTMRYRLADFNVYSGDICEFMTQFVGHFRACASVKYVRCFDFTHIDSKRVFVKFGTSCFSCNRCYLGHLHYYSFSSASDTVALFKRYARHGTYVYRK